ncbi:unnamed protein product [Rhizopus stolonifer]
MASSLTSLLLKEDPSETDQKNYRTCDDFSQDSLSIFVKPKSLFDDKSPNEEEVVWEKISHDLWFKLNIQLGPGMDTELLIYEDSDPLKLSREFFYNRSIRVTEEALGRVAHTISSLIKAKREKNQ